MTGDPAATLDHLFRSMVLPPGASAEDASNH
jgi:hypothetical protein